VAREAGEQVQRTCDSGERREFGRAAEATAQTPRVAYAVARRPCPRHKIPRGDCGRRLLRG